MATSIVNRLRNATSVLFDKGAFSSAIQDTKSTSFGSLSDHFRNISGSSRKSTQLNTSQKYLSAVETVNFVGRCVTTIAGDIGAMGWEIYEDGSNKVIEKSKSDALLLEPSKGVNSSIWVSSLASHLMLDGNMFVKPNLFEKGINPSSIFSLDILVPSKVRVYNERNNEITAGNQLISAGACKYKVITEYGETEFLPEEIYHGKINCINNMLRGMGIVQLNAQAMEQDLVSNALSNQFFEKGVFSNILITPPNDMSPEQFELWQELMTGKISGHRNWMEPLYTLPGGDITALNMSLKDMEMLEKQKFTKQSIASAFYLPDLIAGLDGTGKYDTAPEQIKIYYTMSLPRFYVPIQQFITSIVKSLDPSKSFRFVPYTYIDKKIMSPVANAAFDRGAITQNEYRELLGLERIEERELDERYMLMAYVPAGMISDNTGAETEKGFLLAGEKATRSQLQFHRASKLVREKIEKKMYPYITEYFEGFEKRSIQGLEKSYSSLNGKSYKGTDAIEIIVDGKKYLIDAQKAIDIDDVFDYRAETEAMKASARKMFTSAVTISIKELNGLLGVDMVDSFSNIKIQLTVEKLARKYVNNTIDTRRDELRKIISDSLREGSGVGEVKKRIQENFDTLKGRDGWKAQRIARTETANAYQQASYVEYVEMGVKTVDVVGCIDGIKPGYDCLKTGIPIQQMQGLVFPPNHTGTIVISEI
jgi:HK97 family phage portal protein